MDLIQFFFIGFQSDARQKISTRLEEGRSLIFYERLFISTRQLLLAIGTTEARSRNPPLGSAIMTTVKVHFYL